MFKRFVKRTFDILVSLFLMPILLLLILIFGTLIMIFGVDFMKWDSFVTKLVSDVFVTIINYGFGFLVFKRLEENLNEK